MFQVIAEVAEKVIAAVEEINITEQFYPSNL